MSVHKTRHGTWFTAYYVHGKQRRRYFATEADARAFDAALKSTSSRSRSGASFSELVNLYVAAKAGTVAASTLDTWAYKFARVINPLLGHVPAAALEPATLDHSRSQSAC